MIQFPGIALLCALLLIQTTARPQPKPCGEWLKAVEIGELPALIDESSGMAASRKYPGRLYHVNDSGDSGRFFVSNINGGDVQEVQIAGFDPRDVEGMAVGPCGRNKTCVFIADIGDNDRKRKTLEVVAVEETERVQSSVRPLFEITIRYPGDAHDAEGFAVHPNGTFYILTKSFSPRLFRLDRSSWEAQDKGVRSLTPVTGLRAGAPPTDLSISDDGSRFLVLTYAGAVEYDQGFSPRPIALQVLQQMESISYLRGSRSFVYSTERARLRAPIMRVDAAPCGG